MADFVTGALTIPGTGEPPGLGGKKATPDRHVPLSCDECRSGVFRREGVTYSCVACGNVQTYLYLDGSSLRPASEAEVSRADFLRLSRLR